MSNILLPTVALQGRLTPFHVIRTSEVKVEPTECFKITEKGKEFYALGKPALAKIAQAAGISFDPALTGVVGQPTSEYIMYRAVARMSLPDGQPVTGIGTVEWFAEQEVEPIKLKIAEAEKKGDTQKAFGLRKALSDAVKYRVPNAESKAMNRAIRQLMGIKAKYEPAELREPFTVPRVEYVPDISNPDVRQLLMARADVTQNVLYGQTADTTTQRPALAPMPEEEVSWPEQGIVEAPEDIGEAEVVEEEEPESFDDLEDERTPIMAGLDPADFVVSDPRSTFKGQTLHSIEGKKPGYCAWVVANKKGSAQLQDACRDYLVAYDPENTVLDGGE